MKPLSFRNKQKTAFPVIYINTSEAGEGKEGIVLGVIPGALEASVDSLSRWQVWKNTVGSMLAHRKPDTEAK